MQLNWLYSCGICQLIPLKLWPNTAQGCDHQSTCMPQLQLSCSAALVPNVLPQRDEGSGKPCAAGFKIISGDQYTTTAQEAVRVGVDERWFGSEFQSFGGNRWKWSKGCHGHKNCGWKTHPNWLINVCMLAMLSLVLPMITSMFYGWHWSTSFLLGFMPGINCH